MAATPVTTTVSYCSPQQALLFHDYEQIADLLRDGDDARPSRGGVLGSGMFAQLLLAASGKLESACLRGQRYNVEDLLAFSAKAAADSIAAGVPVYNAGWALLQKLVADLMFWELTQRRQPASANPDRVPGAKEALATLEALKTGERIFPFLETQLASEQPSTVLPNPGGVGRLNGSAFGRIFGSHGS